MKNANIIRELTKSETPLSSEYALEISNQGTEAVYVDRAWTPDQESPTVTTLRSNKLNKVSRSPLFPAVYNTSAKGGRQLVAKREVLFKHEGADGVIYQDPMKVTISCEIGNGLSNYLNTTGRGKAGQAIADELTRISDVLIHYELGEDEDWVRSENQTQIDAMLWGSAEWKNIPEDDSTEYTVAPDGIILNEVAAEADRKSMSC